MERGQIRKINRDVYEVTIGEEIVMATGRGVFRKRKVHPLVGDAVSVERQGEGEEALITEVHERRNSLVRPPIANVDQAMLVFSIVEPKMSYHLLDRFLAVFEYHSISPFICLTKADVASEEELQSVREQMAYYTALGYEVIETYKGDDTLAQRLAVLFEGKTTVLAGQSGVGKSTILNTIAPQLALETAAISTALGRGRHTTRNVVLNPLFGGLVADTPGFSSIDFEGIEKEELRYQFVEMGRIGEGCKFRGCLHLKEPKCAVKAAVETGEIAPHRYAHYEQFMEEIMNRKPRY